MRNTVILLMAFIMLLGFTACGKPSEPPATTPPVTTPPATKEPSTQPPSSGTPTAEPAGEADFSVYFAGQEPEVDIIAEYSDGGEQEYLTELVLTVQKPVEELNIVAIGMAEDGFYIEEVLKSVGSVKAGQGISLKLALMDMPTKGISCSAGGETMLFEVNTSAMDGSPYAGRLDISES